MLNKLVVGLTKQRLLQLLIPFLFYGILQMAPMCQEPIICMWGKCLSTEMPSRHTCNSMLWLPSSGTLSKSQNPGRWCSSAVDLDATGGFTPLSYLDARSLKSRHWRTNTSAQWMREVGSGNTQHHPLLEV